MNITAVIIAAVIVGGTGLFIGVFLGLAGKKFAVEVDEREEAILGVLPGNNCGGTCVKACPFDAIHIVDGVAVVDKEACKACGKCVAACPRKLIEIVPYDMKHLVKCNSKDKGKDVMKACKVGCIGCKMCEKACQFDAVKVLDNVAHIDPEKCTGCGACAAKCPKKVIL